MFLPRQHQDHQLVVCDCLCGKLPLLSVGGKSNLVYDNLKKALFLTSNFIRNLVDPLMGFFLTKNSRSSASMLWSGSKRKWRTNKSVQYGVPWSKIYSGSIKKKLFLWFIIRVRYKYLTKIPLVRCFLRSFLRWKLTSSSSCSSALGDREWTFPTIELNLSQLTAIPDSEQVGINSQQEVISRLQGKTSVVWIPDTLGTLHNFMEFPMIDSSVGWIHN